MEARNLATMYDLPTLDWEPIHRVMDSGITQAPDSGGPDRHTSWLTTVDPDGTPHTTAVGALWVDGCYWFQTGPSTRKARNLARSSRCSMAVSTHDFDLVVEGTAEPVTDPGTVAVIAATWAEGGWPARPDETGQAIIADYNAPSAGPPPWTVYRLTPTAATAVSTVEPGGATRWTF
jgi:hypothetical protein